jgi:YD repeat-containing protein
MKKRVMLLVVMGIGAMGLKGSPVDLSSPAAELGAAGSKGHLEIWNEVPEVGLQLGSTYLPFRYKFSSDRSVQGVLGAGFYAPMLEAHSVLIRPRVMKAGLPCGKSIYFWQVANDANKYQSVDKEWSGEVKGGDFTFRRSDGWEIGYRQGKLSSITCDDRHTYRWSYNGNRLSSIERDGMTVISIGSGSDGQLISLTAHNKNYVVAYGARPMPEVRQGKVVVIDDASVLSKISGPGYQGAEFLFKMNPQGKPTLTLKEGSGQETTYTWNPANGILMSEEGPEGKWSYQVGKVTQEFGLPPLKRTSSDGKTESVVIDHKMGTYTVQGSDGVKRVTQVFTAPGPLYDKVKKVEESKHGVQKASMKASYDEAGRLIRKIDEQGNITTFNYDQNGKLVGKTEVPSPAKAQKIREKEGKLLKSLEKTQNPEDRDVFLLRLGLLYIHDKGDHAKALSLLGGMTNPEFKYILQLHSITYDDSKTNAQKHRAYEKLKVDFPEKAQGLEPYLKQTSPSA